MFALLTNDSVVNPHTHTFLTSINMGPSQFPRGERGSGGALQVRGSGYLDGRRCSLSPCVLFERRREGPSGARTTRLGNRKMSNGVRRTDQDMNASTVSPDRQELN
ncbi:hypothetical protein NCU17067 [Neurospora crassa OR74A]|uniref:Uncharacterized protein n=1 Tax=Neurospora crassa (strain ATCC 24698 / 74-OR23-1A / CBS 708.71 / DSM 1257 / FGSC 987) TaxID=367110 RepID=V5ILW4_NEUCR|nr:hypothetical protein NCU17067 [Neurospora crassa OR74A]ESA42119.1 hypothetical protein NCU17067 [Neurospora crassa OR74A]|eukprot:XP_011395079.1 hypothetical protein NCU17067 [Neurospora crassa OR74A]